MLQKLDDGFVEPRERSGYDSLPRPLLRILIVLIFLLIIGFVILEIIGSPVVLPVGREKFDYTMLFTFAINLAVFMAVWIVYFSSPLPAPVRCQTLRILLRTETKPWASDRAAGEQSISRNKASSAITAQAVFIAISVFIINMIADQNGLVSDQGSSPIEMSFALAALLSAALSFVLLLISVDALETTFNEFVNRELMIVRYFYRLAAGLKYYGFVLSVLSIIFFLFVLNPIISCLTLASFLIFGYPYWFPTVESTARTRVEVWIFRIALLLFNVVALSSAV